MNQKTYSKIVRAWMDENQNQHVCQCGCGESIVIKIHHHTRGIPKFVNGHTSRVKHPMAGRCGKLNPHYHGGRYISPSGYVMILIPGPGRSEYIPEHRLVMEQHLGRPLTNDEIVHHKNRIKTDNRIENLELMANSKHSSIHARSGESGFILLRQKHQHMPWSGEKNGNAKLKEEDIRVIRVLAKQGLTNTTIAIRFSVSSVLISLIVRRKLWKHI